MRLWSYAISIARPREAVFEYFTDWSKSPEWRLYVTSMEQESPGPLGVGSQVKFVIDHMGEEITYHLTVLTYERPSLWRHRTSETHFGGYIEYRFDDEGSGTRVTFSCIVTPKSLLGWLAMPQLWLSRNTAYRTQLPQLKRALEET